jgi:serine phosphatase RsbU (regulator of sigma subunit)
MKYLPFPNQTNKIINYFLKYIVLFFVCCFLLIPLSSNAQIKQIDSILNNIPKYPDRNFVNAINELSYKYIYTSPDSALLLLNLAKKISIDKQFHDVYISINNTIAYVYEMWSNYDTALYLYEKSLKKANQLDDTIQIVKTTNYLGIVYNKMGNFEKAISTLHIGLAIIEKQNNKVSLSKALNNLGSIYYSQGMEDQALKYFQKSFELKKELKDTVSMISSLNNIGIIYHIDKNYMDAKNYFMQSLELAVLQNDLSSIGESYNNLGENYFMQKNYNKAIYYLEKSLGIKSEMKDRDGLAASYINMVRLNLAISDSLKNTDRKRLYVNQAINYGTKALKLGEEVNSISTQHDALKELIYAYQKANNASKALEISLQYLSIRDSIFNKDKAMVVAEVNAKYESEKKQKEIENQKILIENQQLHIKQKDIERIALLFALFISLIIALVIYISYRNKRRSNKIIKEKNNNLKIANAEINAQKEEILSQRDEIEAQRDKVMAQKEEIEKIHYKLTSSIDYALLIQQSVLPDKSALNKMLGEHFIFFKPHSVVSGDFYWVSESKDNIVFCVADCTGHGVPGALMSMLGMSFLNEIVNIRKELNPAIILNQLRSMMISELQQNENNESYRLSLKNSLIKDGMDMALCVYNTKEQKLEFAGARNSVCIIRNSMEEEILGCNKIIEKDNSLFEIKGDKMPISSYLKMDSFTKHEISLLRGDMIYLFSDGFADQFGGNNNKKYGTHAFKSLLCINAYESMQNQKSTLSETFKLWKGENEQIDDVCVLGMKVQ